MTFELFADPRQDTVVYFLVIITQFTSLSTSLDQPILLCYVLITLAVVWASCVMGQSIPRTALLG